jgi:hypothetical protein
MMMFARSLMFSPVSGFYADGGRPGTGPAQRKASMRACPDTWPNLDAQFLGDRPIRVHGTTQFSISAGRNRCRQSIAPATV